MVIVKLMSGAAETSERYPPPSTAPTEAWERFMRELEAAIRWRVVHDEVAARKRDERMKGGG